MPQTLLGQKQHYTTQELKKGAGWKASADRCKNCDAFKPSVFSQPPMVPGAPGLKGSPSMCRLNTFITAPNAWCEDYKRRGTKDKTDESAEG